MLPIEVTLYIPCRVSLVNDKYTYNGVTLTIVCLTFVQTLAMGVIYEEI